MSAFSSVDIEDRLSRLHKSYGATLRDKIERLRGAAEGFYLSDEKRVRVSLEEARALSHNVAGSAATFGYGRVGQLARALEYRLEDILGGRAGTARDSRDEIEDFLRQIAREEQQSQVSAATQTTPARRHRLLIARGRRWMAREFVLAFERHGFEIQVTDDYESTISHADAFRPDVLIITLEPGEIAGFDLATRFWSEDSFARVEVFLFVKSEEFYRNTLSNGVSDEWLIFPPFESQELASRVLRRVFNIKTGRESNNKPYLAPYLEMLKRIAVPDGDPFIFTPPAALFSAALTADPTQRSPNPTRKKVLVVDDDRHLVEAICEVLKDSGVQLFRAHSGFQGAQLAAKEIPDLIITDFEMPNGSAEYLVTNLRQSESTKPIKVILMTGHEVLNRFGLNHNIASYLRVVSFYPKPIDLDGLRGEVRRQLNVL